MTQGTTKQALKNKKIPGTGQTIKSKITRFYHWQNRIKFMQNREAKRALSHYGKDRAFDSLKK